MIYTVAYPRVSPEDAEFIATFRRAHDLPYRDVVGAHFTLVFGCDEIGESQYLRHVEQVVAVSKQFEFCCRYAMIGTDAEDDMAYVFLVPDQGYSDVSLLHDRLYTGPLEPHLRLDIPFIPHINIGTLPDRQEAKKLCDQLNEGGLSIPGWVDRVTVGALDRPKFRDITSYTLPA